MYGGDGGGPSFFSNPDQCDKSFVWLQACVAGWWTLQNNSIRCKLTLKKKKGFFLFFNFLNSYFLVF
jgi:hypothetical protein